MHLKLFSVSFFSGEDQERIEKIQDSYTKVIKTIRYNKPFYSEEVYISAEQITNESFRQLVQKLRPIKSKTDPYIEVEKRYNKGIIIKYFIIVLKIPLKKNNY